MISGRSARFAGVETVFQTISIVLYFHRMHNFICDLHIHHVRGSVPRVYGMMDEITTTKRVGSGAGTYVIRIKDEARLLGVKSGDILELRIRVLDRGDDWDEDESRDRIHAGAEDQVQRVP